MFNASVNISKHFAFGELLIFRISPSDLRFNESVNIRGIEYFTIASLY